MNIVDKIFELNIEIDEDLIKKIFVPLLNIYHKKLKFLKRCISIDFDEMNKKIKEINSLKSLDTEEKRIEYFMGLIDDDKLFLESFLEAHQIFENNRS